MAPGVLEGSGSEVWAGATDESEQAIHVTRAAMARNTEILLAIKADLSQHYLYWK
jgi:hypothetical protein